MSWGRMAADGNGGGGIAAVRPPPPFSQAAGPSGGNWLLQGRLAASLTAAGVSGGKLWPLQGRHTLPSFNGAAAVEYSLCYLQVLLFLF